MIHPQEQFFIWDTSVEQDSVPVLIIHVKFDNTDWVYKFILLFFKVFIKLNYISHCYFRVQNHKMSLKWDATILKAISPVLELIFIYIKKTPEVSTSNSPGQAPGWR